MKKISKGYILSIVSAVLLLLEVCGVKVDVPYVNEIVMAVLGVLVALGLVTGTSTTIKNKTNSDGTSDDESDKVTSDDIIDNVSEKLDEFCDDIDDKIDDILKDK